VPGPPVKNLDDLPFPDFSLVKGLDKSPLFLAPISTSRGCPFDCSFCSVTKIFGRQYRFRSPENIIRELIEKKHGEFFFCDDNFTAHPGRTRKLLNLMRRYNIGRWSCQVRCDVAKDEQLLRLMAKSGCKLVCIGFESVNHETLRAYDKKQTVEEIIGAIRSFRRRRIKIHGMFVLGSDADGQNTVWETLRFAVKQRIDTIQMMILTPFPGTRVYDELDGEKRIFTKDWQLYDGQHIVFNPKLISAKDLQASVLTAYGKFYALSRAIPLFLKFSFRNAFFRLMGYCIVRRWKKLNHGFYWLKNDQPVR